MTAIIESDANRADLLRATLAGAVVVESPDHLGTHLKSHPNETVVVVGPSVSTEAAVGFALAQRVSRPALGVILVRSRIDSTLLSEAMRAGIREVVDARDLTELSDAVHRTRTLGEMLLGDVSQQSVEAEGKLLTVFSTKGGVGKTTIATNVGVALASGGHRVCVVDLDVEAGDVAVMLRLQPVVTLASLGDLRGAINPDTVGSMVTEHQSGVEVVAAPFGADSREQLSADEVGRMLTCLKSMYDVVIVDTAGSFDEYALHAFDASDLLLLVATLDIPALKNLKVSVGTLDLLNLDRDDWRLVVNRADDKAGLSLAEFQDTIGIDIAATLPSSRDVLACVNRGQAIVEAMPRHKLSRTIRGLAESVAASSGAPAKATGEANSDGGSRGGRFLHRKERVAE